MYEMCLEESKFCALCPPWNGYVVGQFIHVDLQAVVPIAISRVPSATGSATVFLALIAVGTSNGAFLFCRGWLWAGIRFNDSWQQLLSILAAVILEVRWGDLQKEAVWFDLGDLSFTLLSGCGGRGDVLRGGLQKRGGGWGEGALFGSGQGGLRSQRRLAGSRLTTAGLAAEGRGVVVIIADHVVVIGWSLCIGCLFSRLLLRSNPSRGWLFVRTWTPLADSRQPPPFVCLMGDAVYNVSLYAPGRVTNSILFSWLFKIKDRW